MSLGIDDTRVLVLGIGNILLKDEGAGIRAVEFLRETYPLPASVSCRDGGTGGPLLTTLLSSYDHVIIIDAMTRDGKPGSIYRVAGEELSSLPPAMATVHQISIRDVLELAALENNGHGPQTVIIGVEPHDIAPGLELTSSVRDALPRVAELVMQELARLGVEGECRNA
ncbi:MAG: HyaD/HybD family hydrogenase maturation endopeptidase [Nitrospirota bacterium]|nr:HyaD/HybD family hydrogenase maturation endopeptidase [Nitrospirota bacterium]